MHVSVTGAMQCNPISKWSPQMVILLYPILVLVSLRWKKLTCINSFIGGVTNTAQYQNRLMVYDPKQVSICVVCVFLMCFAYKGSVSKCIKYNNSLSLI